MLIRLLGAAALSCALLSGCTNTKQAGQTDSKFILRKADSDPEIHGEAAMMYGNGNLSPH
jgi:hypothetical protein